MHGSVLSPARIGPAPLASDARLSLSVNVMGEVPRGWSGDPLRRYPRPHYYSGRTGAELWKICRVRYWIRRGMERTKSDVDKLYGMTLGIEEEKQYLFTQKLEAAEGKKCCFIQADSKFRQFWDMVQVVLLLNVALMVPYREGFSVEVEPWSDVFWWEAAVDAYFIVDIFLSFRTAVLRADGSVVRSSRIIARTYMRGWFIIDVLACLPVTYVQLAISGGDDAGSGGQSKALKILRLLRLGKLLRVARLKRLLVRYQDEFDNMHQVGLIIRLLGMILALGYITHLFCCLWRAVGLTTTASDDGSELLVGWVERTGLVEVDRTNGTGTGESVKLRYPLHQQYLASFYWSITTLTTVGYGDISAVTGMERVVSIIAEMAGGMIFGLLVGMLSSIIREDRMADRLYKQKMAAVTEFVRVKRVPRHLRRQIRFFFENMYKRKSVFDENIFLTELQPALARELVGWIYRDIIGITPLFNDLPTGHVTEICLAMRPYTATVSNDGSGHGETVMKYGDEARNMFIIVEGQVQMMRHGVLAERLSNGSFFGLECVVEYYVTGYHGGGSGPVRFHDASESKCTETAMATGTGDCHLVFISREKASEKMLRYKQFEINMLRSYQKRVRRQEREIEKLQMKRALLMKPQTTSDSVGGQNDLPGQISTAVGHPVPSCAHHIL